MRYGLHEHLEALCRGQFEAARLFDFYRLPEVFSGHARDADHPFPALYPADELAAGLVGLGRVLACSSRCWGSTLTHRCNVLLVDPHLPEPGCPEITLRNLRVGEARSSLCASRARATAATTRCWSKRGRLHVVRQPSPWSLTAGFAERLRDALSSLLP